MGVDVSAGLKIMVMIMSFWCDSSTSYHVTVINNTVYHGNFDKTIIVNTTYSLKSHYSNWTRSSIM